MHESRDMPDPVQIGRAIDAAILQPGSESVLLASFNAWRRYDSDIGEGEGPVCPDQIDVLRAIDGVINNWGE